MRTCQVKTKRQIGSVFEHFDMTFAGNGRRRTKNRLRVRCPFNSNERQFDGRALAFAFWQLPAASRQLRHPRQPVSLVAGNFLVHSRRENQESRRSFLYAGDCYARCFIPVGENFLNHWHFGDSGVNLVGDKSIRFVIDRLIDHGTTFLCSAK